MVIEQKPVNVWKVATIALAVVVLFLMVSPLIQEKEAEKMYLDNLVDNLIENKIIFVYSSGCSACHKQIEIFGEDWQRYIDSKLTLDCATHSSQICDSVRVTPSWVQTNGTAYELIAEGVIGQ